MGVRNKVSLYLKWFFREKNQEKSQKETCAKKWNEESAQVSKIKLNPSYNFWQPGGRRCSRDSGLSVNKTLNLFANRSWQVGLGKAAPKRGCPKCSISNQTNISLVLRGRSKRLHPDPKNRFSINCPAIKQERFSRGAPNEAPFPLFGMILQKNINSAWLTGRTLAICCLFRKWQEH